MPQSSSRRLSDELAAADGPSNSNPVPATPSGSTSTSRSSSPFLHRTSTQQASHVKPLANFENEQPVLPSNPPAYSSPSRSLSKVENAQGHHGTSSMLTSFGQIVHTVIEKVLPESYMSTLLNEQAAKIRQYESDLAEKDKNLTEAKSTIDDLQNQLVVEQSKYKAIEDLYHSSHASRKRIIEELALLKISLEAANEERDRAVKSMLQQEGRLGNRKTDSIQLPTDAQKQQPPFSRGDTHSLSEISLSDEKDHQSIKHFLENESQSDVTKASAIPGN